MTTKRKRTRSEAKARTRQAFLDAGVEELAESLTSPVENVKSSKVAERVDLTTGAFYHHWETQEEFQTELRKQVMHEGQVLEIEKRVADSIGALTADGVRLLVRSDSDATFRDSLWRVQLAMLASQVPEDVACARAEYELWVSRLVGLYTSAIHAADLALRPGLEPAWFARSLSAIIEGFGLQRLADYGPDRLDAGWREVELTVGAFLLGVLQTKGDQPVSIPDALDGVLRDT